MKLISWNVNGIRAVLKKGFLDFLSDQDPDIICLQETKAMEEQVDESFEDYPYKYWNSAEKKGYSGTAVFSKVKPINIKYGMDIERHDTEGRVITCEFEEWFLVTVYTPNSKRDLTRLEYRQKEWDIDFLKYVRNLEEKKPVIFCGDLNVAHREIDLANPRQNKRNAGFTDEEREGFDNIVNSGFYDTFRMFNDEPGNYSWWSYMGQARAKNIGWRIDYFCISSQLKDYIESADIHASVLGSDHAPIELVLK
jgi:exodeoxyribonuclease-3